ncbi:hypothetical protein L0337_43800, partial [candidate division KSB1 bacterium]|nr:hypothetical protein [candidate division KSB1 bacterium]
WSSAAKSQPPQPEKPVSTGIKPLEQLAQKHHEQKQEQAQKLMGIPPSGSPPSPEPPFTIATFIHLVATALDTTPEAMHAREIERFQNFWKMHQPLGTETVSIAMAKAILIHGKEQHLDVYLEAIKTLHLKWQEPASNPSNNSHSPEGV